MAMFKTIFFSLMYALFNVSGAALIKSELKNRLLTNAQDYIDLLFKLKVIAGFAIIFLSALIFFKALSLAKFSVVMPIAIGINFGLTILFGYFLFSEKITFFTFLGLALILGGIIIIGMNNYN